MKNELNNIETSFIEFAKISLVADDIIKTKTGNFNLLAKAEQHGDYLEIKIWSHEKLIWIHLFNIEENYVVSDGTPEEITGDYQ